MRQIKQIIDLFENATVTILNGQQASKSDIKTLLCRLLENKEQATVTINNNILIIETL